jgi:gluconolactonase
VFGTVEWIDTEVAGRLPDDLRSPRDAREIFGARKVDSFLEGPSFDADGNLLCVDVAGGRVLRMTQAGQFSVVAEYEGFPSGLKFAPDGRVVLADHRKGILKLDVESGEVTPLVTTYDGKALKGCNDLFFGPNGDLYFTDQGHTALNDPTGRVFRLDTDGQLDLLIDTAPSPNGLVLSADGTNNLYVAVTRANAVWRVPLIDGGVGRVGTFLQLSGGLAGPDGMALDEDDGLYVAHAGLGMVWGYTKLGEPRYGIRSCAGVMTTNLAFGGPDMRDLYITESATGSILRARLPIRGRQLFTDASRGSASGAVDETPTHLT